MSIPLTVIIAEPDPMISSVLRVEFSQLDFAVFLASSGEEAEDYAAQTIAHLIVLDSRLHMGAYEACARIRRRQGYAGRPIVVTTTQPSAKIRAAADKAGATLVLPKPYSINDLFSAIGNFLPADDPLLTHRARASGVGAPTEWAPMQNLTWSSGSDSALTRNGRLLPIVRGRGVKVPIIRKP
jgi:DNA-binding response OmpR family regulator